MLAIMHVTLVKALIALVPMTALFSGSAVLFFKGDGVLFPTVARRSMSGGGRPYPYLRKHFICFPGCIGALSIALVITSISGALFLVSPCFP